MTCLVFISMSAVPAEISRGAMLSNSCAACHGTHGKSPGAIPSINGKSASFLSKALKDFRSGERPSTVMGRHAKGYTDEEIELIAQHFSRAQP
ncbi:MAG: cytochrome C [Gammaproteobacteria bacterium]|jgi:sulfide dehydrogenase cytochrome subunit